MSALRFSIPLLLLALSVQAADRDSELARLEANRAKWVEHGIDDYWVRLRDEACWCLYGPYYGPIRLLVRNGKIRKAIYHGERRDGYWPGRSVEVETALKATIEEVFENAKRVILTVPEGAYRIEYDKQFGFPMVIDVDRPDWEDEQWRLVVDGFKPLE
jgi:hypothetical protein